MKINWYLGVLYFKIGKNEEKELFNYFMWRIVFGKLYV